MSPRDNANNPPPAIISLYDESCRLVWASWFLPGLAELVPFHIWDHLESPGREAVQVAMLDCLVNRSSRAVNLHGTKSGLDWQLVFYPCRIGKIRIASISSVIPKKVVVLTTREAEVCKLLATGKTSKQIAGILSVARSTVDNLRASAARRLGIQPSALVAWSVEHREWL
jgi:DNA-binding CsgD family transcriptional regulator